MEFIIPQNLVAMKKPNLRDRMDIEIKLAIVSFAILMISLIYIIWSLYK